LANPDIGENVFPACYRNQSIHINFQKFIRVLVRSVQRLLAAVRGL